MAGLAKKRRIEVSGKSLAYVRFYDDFPYSPISNIWLDTGTGSFTEAKVYAVQTGTKVVARCINMTTKPGDIVLDITCGSGTTAVCAERLGRRWITCDTSRVAVNVARQRLLSSIFEHYQTSNGTLASDFKYTRVPRLTLKSIAYDLEPETVELFDEPTTDSIHRPLSGLDCRRVAAPADFGLLLPPQRRVERRRPGPNPLPKVPPVTRHRVTGIAVLAPRRHRPAPNPRVPGRVGPGNLGDLAHAAIPPPSTTTTLGTTQQTRPFMSL